jgi:hypothetical protein
MIGDVGSENRSESVHVWENRRSDYHRVGVGTGDSESKPEAEPFKKSFTIGAHLHEIYQQIYADE